MSCPCDSNFIFPHLHHAGDSRPDERVRQKANDSEQIERDDCLIFVRVPLCWTVKRGRKSALACCDSLIILTKAPRPDVSLESGAGIVIWLLKFGALADIQPLVQAELAGACRTGLVRIDGREEWDDGRVGRKACALAHVHRLAFHER